MPLPSALQVLAIDDDTEALQACRLMLRMGGVENVICCQDPREAMGFLGKHRIEIVLLDLTMPYLSGQELLRMIVEEHPDVPVAVITAAQEIDSAVACMRDGAFDYLVKPVERSRLLSTVQRAAEMTEWRRACSRLTERILSDKLEHPEVFAPIVTGDPAMRAVFRCVEAVAKTSKPVLVTGETGVGKELVARALHVISERQGPFVAVNIAGLDEHLLSDALFGHRPGAFTGADTRKAGLVEKAAGGTLFLDEVGDLTPSAQIKLLRLLQEHEYFPVGADSPEFSDARVIAATHKDLQALQETGMFRRDLYFRLICHHIHVPALRERQEDIPILARHFLELSATALGKKTPTPPKELFDLLASYAFPGNVRELESMIFDAVSRHHSKTLSLDAFREYIGPRSDALNPQPPSAMDIADSPFASWPELPTLDDADQLLTQEALRRARGNQTTAARMLGISQPALSKRLKRMRD